jgi:hypothetical protein
MVREVAVEGMERRPERFRFLMIIIALLIFVAMPDAELEQRARP